MSRDIGIDLGTANVLIHLKGRGIVLNEPAVVTVDSQSQDVIAVGREAYEMIGRTPPSIQVIHPLKGGVIDDYDMTEAMLMLFLEKMNSRSWFSKPNILICAPSNISEIERTSLVEAAERAGGGRIYIEEEPKVAGIGAGIDILDPSGSMVIDIGGGTSDIAVISSGEIISSESIKMAGDQFDDAITQYFKDNFQLLIGERSAEQIKISLASALPLEDDMVETHDLKGRDLVTGLPKSINVNSNHIYEAIKDQIIIIARAAKRILEDTPPEVAADIIEKGIILTGGGAMIFQMDTYLTEYLKVSVLKAEQPMNCVAIGTGLMLEMITNGKLERTNPTRQQKFVKFLKRLKRRLIG
ncbi:MreB/Mrl family cell shape determining protein [Aerococcaceae bacterium DSM 109653]|uniref:Cell shape-determining protein MreB n=1 Tax=Fundicoccus ignavus TaxID=2664442 RepID=A0A844BHN4_9LACT|nr:rod shape-determining protein [Fundicoccus ignavus]MRI81495.1 MreB/Mrl family cell shape determining protein [Fundicoccus ignavus]